MSLFEALIFFEQLNYHVILGILHVELLGLDEVIKGSEVSLHVVDSLLYSLLNLGKLMDDAKAYIVR